MNTTEFLTIAAAICPDREAIIFEGKRITFQQLNERVNRLANALKKMGVQKGDKVGLIQVNCNQCVETYFAVAKIGGMYVPLNFRAKGDELEYMINFAEISVLFLGTRYIDIINPIRAKLNTVKHYISLESKRDDMHFYEDILAKSPDDEPTTDVHDNDTTILMFTAGTTGRPKAVMLTHDNFTNYVLSNVTPADPTVEEKNILTVPLYHIAGTQAMMSAIYGGRTIIMERQFEPVEWMGLVQKEKANRAMMVPTMLKQLMDHADFGKYDLKSLKVITYGAAPMPLPVIEKALEVFPGVSFINAFGQTESASTITMLSPQDHIISGDPKERQKKLKRLTSIGKPLPDVQMKVIDQESGKELGPNKVGEIVAKGKRVMAGYYKDAEKTAKTIDKDGWLHTGDLGYRDEDGYYFLAGRSSDIIIRAGENIAPEELEMVIRRHPKVDDVAVIGVPDETWGEEPRAIVVIKKGQQSTSEEIMEFCRVNLASYKRPRSVIFVDELPRNPMGKVLKRVLREQYGKP